VESMQCEPMHVFATDVPLLQLLVRQRLAGRAATHSAQKPRCMSFFALSSADTLRGPGFFILLGVLGP
jgi:hypothetical protein